MELRRKEYEFKCADKVVDDEFKARQERQDSNSNNPDNLQDSSEQNKVSEGKEANENVNAKPGKRGSVLKRQCKIIRSVLDCHIKEKCEHLVLPSEVKRIFQQPSDERKPMC